MPFTSGQSSAPGRERAASTSADCWAVIALAIVQVVLTAAVAAFAPREAKAPSDERERLIDLRATRFAYAALAGSVACACFFGGFNPPIIFNANALLFILVVAEILRSGCQIVQYRRGA